MFKQLKEDGPNGSFTATITIAKRNELIDVHNPSTHEEDKKNVPRWDIKVNVDGRDWVPRNPSIVKDIKSEMEVLNNAAKVEKELEDYLGALAHNKPTKTLEEKLKERGYT